MQIKIVQEVDALPFKLEDISDVYIGKQGCACGCGGNYYHNPGCTKYDYDIVNPTMVKKVFNKVVALATGTKEYDYKDAKPVHMQDEYIFSIELENRAYRIYLKKPVQYKKWGED